MLIGSYIHQFDEKKRFSIPSKWRVDLGKKVVVTSGLDKSLFIFSLKEWGKIAEKISCLSFTNKEVRSFTRFILANASDVEIDAAGRILLTDNLKKFAGINSKIVLVGMHNRIELWDENIWERYSKINDDKADELAAKLNEIGIL